MEGPADTLNYMLAGYGVIFGTMILYIVSLFIRWRNLKQDENLLQEIKKEK